MSGNVERSRTLAACSTVAGVLIAPSADVVSFAAPFFAPHPKRKPTAHTTSTFFMSFFRSIARDDIELNPGARAASFAVAAAVSAASVLGSTRLWRVGIHIL